MKISDENLIFLVSQPRSGSTMLQALLSNNNEVSTSSEPWVAIPFLMLRGHESMNEATHGSMFAIDEYLTSIPQGDELWNDTIKNAVLNLYTPKFNDFNRYMLDKTPRYYEVLPELKHYFPNSKIIILKRNPLAVLNSIIDTWFSEGNGKVSDLVSMHRDILEAPKLIDDFINNSDNDGNVIVTHYENIIAKPEAEIQRLYEFLELDFSSENLDFSENKKYQGCFGDSKILSTNGLIHSKSELSWEAKLSDAYWGDFFRGYINYLGKDRILKQSGLDHVNVSNTMMFRYYLFKCRWAKPSLKYFLTYFIKDNVLFRKWRVR